MSAQIRYRTLVGNMTRLYSAPAEARADYLQTGLDEIMAVNAPSSAAGWGVVGGDSRRLLKVWLAKETDPAAKEVAEQLTDLLGELSLSGAETATAAPALVIPPSPPSLVVFEAPKPADKIAYAEELVPIPKANLISLAEAAALEGSVASSILEEEEEEEVLVEIEEEEVVAAPAPAAKAPVEVEEAEEEVVEEEEIVEETEEEEGLEVEPIMIRGRKYWLGSDKQIYAVIDDDDVGDAVGEMVDGKPRFFAK